MTGAGPPCRAGRGATLALAALMALSGTVAPAAAPDIWQARNTMRVVAHPSDPAVFEVISRALAGPADTWCAAGDYARRRLGADPSRRLYLLRGTAPSPLAQGRKATAFTLAPPPALQDGRRPGEGGRYGLTLDEPGFNLRVGHARAFCADSLRRLTRPGLF